MSKAVESNHLDRIAAKARNAAATAESETNAAFNKIDSYEMFKGPMEELEGLGTGHICLKRTIVAINVFFLILGIILTVLGSAASSDTYASLAGDTAPTGILWGILIIGVFIIVLSLVGCCGAKRESRFILSLYSAVLLLLIIAQLCLGMALYIKQDDAPNLLRAGWNRSTNDFRVVVQNSLLCCGLEVYNFSMPLNLPVASQALVVGLAGQPCPDPNIFPASIGMFCLPIMIAKIKASSTTAAVVAIVFSFLEVIGLGFALCLIRGIRQMQEEDQIETPQK